MPELAFQITHGLYKPINPGHCNQALSDLVHDMLHVQPEKRPTMLEVLRSPLLKIYLCKLEGDIDSSVSCTEDGKLNIEKQLLEATLTHQPKTSCQGKTEKCSKNRNLARNARKAGLKLSDSLDFNTPNSEKKRGLHENLSDRIRHLQKELEKELEIFDLNLTELRTKYKEMTKGEEENIILQLLGGKEYSSLGPKLEQLFFMEESSAL